MPQEKCPICGKPGYRVIARRRNKLYVYYKHFDKLGDKVVQRNCYAGPIDGYNIKTVERAIKQLDVEKIYTLLSDEQRRKLAQLLC